MIDIRAMHLSGVDFLRLQRAGVDALRATLKARTYRPNSYEGWRGIAAGLPDATRVVENTLAREALDAGLSLWQEPQTAWKKTDLFGDGRSIGLVGHIEKTLRELRGQADELAAKLETLDVDEPAPIAAALDELAFAFGCLLEAADQAEQALTAVKNAEPRGNEASGQALGQRISGGKGEFKSFAIAARTAWQQCGEPVKGDGSSFEIFLDRIHEAVMGCAIPSRGKLLGMLRNDFGNGSRHNRWK